jgi:hypothetical protein
MARETRADPSVAWPTTTLVGVFRLSRAAAMKYAATTMGTRIAIAHPIPRTGCAPPLPTIVSEAPPVLRTSPTRKTTDRARPLPSERNAISSTGVRTTSPTSARSDVSTAPRT